ncbi:class I SAM-dependent methyltransferase [Dyella monticola]|uniref:Class I SAM-dependent methyltransferase n=1 Tax=Dyella monticola TaxID=1927958 RepID=A0A370X4K6_9GAMM|nr:class I SAM-dependent methyltransferase [Dyella monticola]RDS83145.1 class I SAM-dependent methyltransferase [Dyella monticola]
MADKSTIDAYDTEAASFAADWETQPSPDDLYALIKTYFTHGLTADIGCGSGRDVAWMNAHGFDAVGYDASPGLLAQAGLRHPGLCFTQAALPELEPIPSHQFRNVLCETVIMHVHPGQIGRATQRLLDILQPHGTLLLTWRVTDGESMRDEHDRLYASFDRALVLDACIGHTLLLDEEGMNRSSGKRVHRIVVRKEASDRDSP